MPPSNSVAFFPRKGRLLPPKRGSAPLSLVKIITIVLYHLDESTGSTTSSDSSGNGLDLTLTDTVSPSISRRKGTRVGSGQGPIWGDDSSGRWPSTGLADQHRTQQYTRAITRERGSSCAWGDSFGLTGVPLGQSPSYFSTSISWAALFISTVL